jgi:hypothetical protein
MMCGITSQDVTTREYPISYALTGSSRREGTDMSDILDWIFFVLRRQELTRQRFFYQSLPPSFEVDLSSVHPYFRPMTMPSLIQEFYEETAPEETLEYDVVVQMPPRKRYTIELQVKSIRKAEAKIVEPEWI